MDEKNDRYDLGEKALKPGQSVWLNYDRFDMPEGDYRLYAERIVEEPLNLRMADYWEGWWGHPPYSDADRHFRMQRLINRFGLVERSKLPDPPEVPEDVKKAASDLSLMYGGAPPLGQVGTLLKWVLEQVGDSDG
ncbi:MAG: hypothetical protein GY701_16655 [Sulfitobacter sp.]|nr:hypothetical protein [Sulfitobacter sp.]